MAHEFSHTNDYLIQLPYLNDGGNAHVIDIKAHSAQMLVSGGSHRVMKADHGLYVLTPTQPAVTGHVFQIGELAV